MTTEQIVRDQLDRATQRRRRRPGPRAPRSGPGRRRRRQRAWRRWPSPPWPSLGLGAVGVQRRHRRRRPTVRARRAGRRRTRSRRRPADFVPGTDIDETLAAVVAAHVARPCRRPTTSTPATATPPARSTTPSSRPPRTGRRRTRSTDGRRASVMITGLPSEGLELRVQGCNPQTVPGRHHLPPRPRSTWTPARPGSSRPGWSDRTAPSRRVRVRARRCGSAGRRMAAPASDAARRTVRPGPGGCTFAGPAAARSLSS